mgnify:FL=1|tara:strand:- start:155 stop:670 length:516 start_codon:yes stop_codon:yes gene_type:complete
MANLNIPNTFSGGELIVAAEVNANFAAIETFVDTSPGVLQQDIVNSKGDVLVASAADTVTRLGVGTNTHVLTANSSATNGIEWAAVATDANMMPKAGGTFTGPVTYQGASPILLTGVTTGNGYEITLTVTDPTADRVITIPNATGTMALVSDIPATVNGTADNIISNQVFS